MIPADFLIASEVATPSSPFPHIFLEEIYSRCFRYTQTFFWKVYGLEPYPGTSLHYYLAEVERFELPSPFRHDRVQADWITRLS